VEYFLTSHYLELVVSLCLKIDYCYWCLHWSRISWSQARRDGGWCFLDQI